MPDNSASFGDVKRTAAVSRELMGIVTRLIDQRRVVRIAAFEALSRMDEKLAASVAGSFLTSTDEDLRQVASNFLALRNGTV